MINVDFKHKYSFIYHVYIFLYLWGNVLAIWQAFELYSVSEFPVKALGPDAADLTVDAKMVPWRSSYHSLCACLSLQPAEGLGHNCHLPLHRNLTIREQ